MSNGVAFALHSVLYPLSVLFEVAVAFLLPEGLDELTYWEETKAVEVVAPAGASAACDWRDLATTLPAKYRPQSFPSAFCAGGPRRSWNPLARSRTVYQFARILSLEMEIRSIEYFIPAMRAVFVAISLALSLSSEPSETR